VDVPGNPTFDPLEDMIFVEELKAGLEKNILVSVVDANMEEPAFADAVVDSCLSIFPKA